MPVFSSGLHLVLIFIQGPHFSRCSSCSTAPRCSHLPPGVYFFYSPPPFNNEHNYLLPGAGRNQVHSKKVNSSGVNFILTSIDIIIDSGPEFAMLFGSAFGDHDQSVKQQVSLESAAKSSI